MQQHFSKTTTTVRAGAENERHHLIVKSFLLDLGPRSCVPDKIDQKATIRNKRTIRVGIFEKNVQTTPEKIRDKDKDKSRDKGGTWWKRKASQTEPFQAVDRPPGELVVDS